MTKTLDTYFNTYSGATQYACQQAEQRGYIITEEEHWNKIAIGNKRPTVGNTNRISLELFKDGKPQRKMLHIQVYNTGTKYELNFYIN